MSFTQSESAVLLVRFSHATQKTGGQSHRRLATKVSRFWQAIIPPGDQFVMTVGPKRSRAFIDNDFIEVNLVKLQQVFGDSLVS
jgi:hypothetical protein